MSATGLSRVVEGFADHLLLERGRSPHTVRAYTADLTALAAVSYTHLTLPTKRIV